MNNKLVLEKISVDESTISYQYNVTGYWKRYFSLNENLYVSYDMKMSGVSYDVAVIPFLYVFMPLAWMFQAVIEVDAVDSETLEGLEKYKGELKQIYPSLRLYETNIIAKTISKGQENRDNTAVYFSGGVDAWATLLEYLDTTSFLVTVIGADIDVDNKDAALRVWTEIQKVATVFSLTPMKIETNMRKVINERRVHKYLYAKSGIGYWQGIAAGIGIIGLSAPLSEKLSIGKVYVSTSITNEQVSTICRDGIIGQFVNAVGWSGTIIKAYGETTNRQEKVEKITAFSKQNKTPIYIRACWRDKTGKNCCKCEKCYRTIMGIAATGNNPCDFGFDIHKLDYIQISFYMKKWFKNNFKGSYQTTPYIFWDEIREKRVSNKWYVKWLDGLNF